MPITLLGQSSIKNAKKKVGRYNITISLPNEFEGRSFDDGEKIYLIKEMWGYKKGKVIDSAIVKNKTINFKGEVYPLEDALESENPLFTAGEYRVKFGSYTLFRFFYSSSQGGDFTEKFKPIPSESPYIQEFTRVKPKRDKYGDENLLYLNLQNFQKLLAMLRVRNLKVGEAAEAHISKMADSLSHLGNFLKLRADTDAPYSLFNILISHSQLPNYTPPKEIGMKDLGDDRLLYTNFGEEIFNQELERIVVEPRTIAIDKIISILENKNLSLFSQLKKELVLQSFKFFKNSNVMGSESIAIAVAEKYILSKEIEVSNQEYFEIDNYHFLNKNTLLGMKAPKLELPDNKGEMRSLDETFGYPTIIYFYTHDCSFCKNETPKLIELLNNYTYSPINFVTVYIGDDKSMWDSYLESFNSINPFVNRIDLADIEKSGSTLLDYGIISTPTLYIIDPIGTIIGRRIKSETAKQVLDNQENSRARIESYFAQLFKSEDVDVVKRNIDTLANASKGDFYLNLMSELYTFLSNSPIYENQIGAAYLGEKYICNQKEIWPIQYVDGVCRAVELFKLNMLGTKATDVNLYDISNLPHSLIEKSSKNKILFFYKPNCGLCTESVAELKKLYKKYSDNYTFTAIYTGSEEQEFKEFVIKNRVEWINLWDKNGMGELRKKYDLESTPQIYLLDKDATIIAKDINVYDLKDIIEQLNKK